MTSIIRTERLTKAYGAHRGIIDVDLEVAENEIFGFLGPNGAGKTTTIRTLLDLIRPTSGRAFVFDIETTVDPVAIHRRIGYIPGEFALYDRLTGGQTIQYFANLRGGVDRGVPGAPDRAPRHRPEPQVQGALQGQQAEDRARHRAPAPAGAADPRRADVRPRPARPADVLRARPRGAAPRAGPSSCRATSCPRSSAPATASRSSATASWSRSTASRPSATSPITRWSCASSDTVPVAAFEALPGRQRRQRRGPHAPAARQRPDHAGRPGGGPLRAARLRQPRAEPRGDVPRPVRPRPDDRRRRGSPGGGVMTAAGPAAGVRAAQDPAVEPDLRPGHRLRQDAPRLAPRRSSSSAACSARLLLSSGAAFGEAYNTPESRQELANLVASLPPVLSGVYGNPFPVNIETLGGSIAWKSGALDRPDRRAVVRARAVRDARRARPGAAASSSSRRRRSACAGSPSRRSRPTSPGWPSSSWSRRCRAWVAGVRVRDAARRRDLAAGGDRVRPLGRRWSRWPPARSRSRWRQFVGRGAAAGIAGRDHRSSATSSTATRRRCPRSSGLANLTWWGWTAHHQPLAGQFDWVDARSRRDRRDRPVRRRASSCSRVATWA